MSVACLGAWYAGAQEGPPKTDSQNEFFSGIVAELSSEKITVSRTVLGKRAERRTFRINSDTRIEGKLSLKARVTVRFTALEDGDLALQILVRPAAQKK